MRRAAALLLACLGGACGPAAGPPAGVDPHPNLVLVSVDTLRADHLGCYGYFRDTSPNVDRLAREAIFFSNAYAPMATTLPAHVSLFTGLEPLEHGILSNVTHGGAPFGWKNAIRSVTDLLREDGYTTAAFVSAVPLLASAGLSVGFEHYGEPEGRERRADATTDEALAWLEANRAARFFLWVHYFDPHWRRDPPPPFDEMFRVDRPLREFLARREISRKIERDGCRFPSNAFKAHKGYDGEVRFTDQQVGRLFDALRELGLWERSVIVFTADHGEGLNQHEWPGHGRVYEEQLRVPLLIRFPGPRTDLPRRFDGLLSLTDVMPTVLGRIGAPAAEILARQATGRDVLAAGFRERSVLSQSSGRDCGLGAQYALTSREWKLIHEPGGADRLFRRVEDPFELHDLAGHEPDAEAALRRELAGRLQALRARGEALSAGGVRAVGGLDPERLRQLEALGYGAEAPD